MKTLHFTTILFFLGNKFGVLVGPFQSFYTLFMNLDWLGSHGKQGVWDASLMFIQDFYLIGKLGTGIVLCILLTHVVCTPFILAYKKFAPLKKRKRKSVSLFLRG
jgi:hypothetical protein